VILILHGDLDPGTVSHSSQWSVHTQERDGCNGCQNVFDGELDSDYADSTGSHSAFGDCPQQKRASNGRLDTRCCISLAAGYFHKRCILPTKETLLYISELVGSGSSS
jgi:hypothetical protein